MMSFLPNAISAVGSSSSPASKAKRLARRWLSPLMGSHRVIVFKISSRISEGRV